MKIAGSKINKRLYFFVTCLCFTILVPAQSDYGNLNLDKKLEEIKELFAKDPDRAYRQTTELLEKSIEIGDRRTELSAYTFQCWFLARKLDNQKLFDTSNELKRKAKEYGSLRHEGVAHIYLSLAYTESELHEKAVSEYEKALLLLEKADQDDPQLIISKANAHIYISNTYLRIKQPEKAVEKLLLAEKEHRKITDSVQRHRLQYHDYSNLATAYLEFNLDSAEYYVLKSIDAKPKDIEQDHIMFLNYSVLGDIHRFRKKYDMAIKYYQIAEKVDTHYTDLLNLEALYKGYIEIYEALGDKEKLEEYRNKLTTIQLNISDSRYKSMHRILENSNKEQESNRIFYLVIYSVAGVILVIPIIFLYRKNKVLAKREQISRQYLNEIKSNEPQKSYEELTAMAVSNNPAFMASFLDSFPGFSEKLLKINPNLAQTEVEFCTYLKLNFTSKEIAQIKSIQPRSVQNKKHRIRKRLNIPENIDIYHWFNNEM